MQVRTGGVSSLTKRGLIPLLDRMDRQAQDLDRPQIGSPHTGLLRQQQMDGRDTLILFGDSEDWACFPADFGEVVSLSMEDIFIALVGTNVGVL